MQMYEYLALPAPRKGSKVKGLKTPAERFAHAITEMMNDVATEGWEFWRSESLPSEERKGFRGTAVVENHLMIFRRPSAESLAEHLSERDTPAAAPKVTPPARTERERADPVLLERPNAETQVHDSRREPMFRTQATGSDDAH